MGEWQCNHYIVGAGYGDFVLFVFFLPPMAASEAFRLEDLAGGFVGLGALPQGAKVFLGASMRVWSVGQAV